MDVQDNNATGPSGQKNYNIGSIGTANFFDSETSKPLNEYLVKELLSAIRDYIPEAQQVLEGVKDIPGWNQIPEYSDYVKELLVNSFGGVLGNRLAKLIAIEKDNQSADVKREDYINNCLTTAKRTLQLLCFAFISDLWVRQKEEKTTLPAELTADLKHFFEDFVEMRITAYYSLLVNLYDYYKNSSINFPIPDIAKSDGQMQAGSELYTACENLQAMSVDKKYTTDNCTESEKQLTCVLSHCSFLANYKMVSIKSIGYEKVRNADARFLHNYIEVNSGDNNKELLNYIGTPTSTDSVLLYRGDYVNGINLSPFIIDLNALNSTGGVKIYFYSRINQIKKQLDFSQLDSPKIIESVTFSDVLKQNANANELMQGKETRTKIKLDMVFLQFMEAKKIILG